MAIADCDKAIAIDNNFLKGYYRKAVALRALCRDEECIELLKSALEKESENDQCKDLLGVAQDEWNMDHAFPADHPEVKRFTDLLDWMTEGGSVFDKLKIRFYDMEGYRGVHARKDIRKGEIILKVPKGNLISLEMA